MPVVPSPLGILPFAAIKLAGYTLAAGSIERAYAREAGPPVSAQPMVMPLLFGFVRTVLGIASGTALTIAIAVFGIGNASLFALMLPIRFGEWLLLVWWFYERRHPRGLAVQQAFLGTLWSFLLDVPAWAAWWFTPGRFYWC